MDKKIKTHALAFEETNFNSLQFVKTSNGYYKLFGHSALIFKGEIADILKYTVNLRDDDGALPISRDGQISFKGIENLTSKLESNGFKMDKTLSNEKFIYFKLLKEYTEKDIEKIRKDIAEEKDSIRKVIIPKNPFPTFYTHVEDLNRMIYENTRKFQAPANSVISTKLFDSSNSILNYYLLYANSKMDFEDFYSKCSAKLCFIKYQMKNVENLKLIHARNIKRILHETIYLEKSLKLLYRNKK